MSEHEPREQALEDRRRVVAEPGVDGARLHGGAGGRDEPAEALGGLEAAIAPAAGRTGGDPREAVEVGAQAPRVELRRERREPRGVDVDPRLQEAVAAGSTARRRRSAPRRARGRGPGARARTGRAQPAHPASPPPRPAGRVQPLRRARRRTGCAPPRPSQAAGTRSRIACSSSRPTGVGEPRVGGEEVPGVGRAGRARR